MYIFYILFYTDFSWNSSRELFSFFFRYLSVHSLQNFWNTEDKQEPCSHLEILWYLLNHRKTGLKAADVQIAAWWAICMKSEHSIWIASILFPSHPPEWPFHLPASQLLSAATCSATSHRRRRLHHCCKALSTFVSCTKGAYTKWSMKRICFYSPKPYTV